MSIAAVPRYLGRDFKSASPGMRFGMYLQAWEHDWQRVRKTADGMSNITHLNASDQAATQAMLARQRMLADRAGDAHFMIEAQSIAPFSTGLGNEHPLENGFAFLHPHGLPYLAGSGVKGVLRQAARELCAGSWGDGHGWNDEPRYSIGDNRFSMMDALFGAESADADSFHLRGALSFWDVIPQMDKLAIDIMTPHQSHYLQGSEVPHDSGAPVPIPFLVIPPETSFVFNMVCDNHRLQRIAPGLEQDWRKLVESALMHAFDWLGFGAKTAVGYGAMQEDPAIKMRRQVEEEARVAAEQARLDQEKQAEQIAAMPPAEQELATCLLERTDKNQPELPTLINAFKAGRWDGDADMKAQVAELIKQRMVEVKKWKPQSQARRPERDRDYQNTLAIMAGMHDG